MSASCSASGLGTTAQSPYTSTLSGSSMKKTLETTETPGRVRMISNDGRMVWAVVCTAPETMPSASTEVDHERAEVGDVDDGVVGHVDGHVVVRAQVGVVRGRSASPQRVVHRVDDVRAGHVDACGGGGRQDRVGVAEQGDVGDAAARARVPPHAAPAARSPSGSTMRRRSARARSNRSWVNMTRGDDVGRGEGEPVEPGVGGHVLGGQLQRRLDLAVAVAAHPAAQPRGDGRDLEASRPAASTTGGEG